MKRWNHIRNILLGALGAGGVGLLLCRMLHYPAEYLWMLSGLGLVSGGLASVGITRERTGQMFCAGITAVLSAAAGTYLMETVWGGIYALAAAIPVYLAVFACGYGFYAPLGFAVVISLLIDLLMTVGVYQAISGTAAIAALLLTIDGLRERSVRKGRLQNQIDNFGTGPAGLTKNSIMLTAIFLAVAILATMVSYLLLRLLRIVVLTLIARCSGTAAGVLAWLQEMQQRFYEWLMSHFKYYPEGPQVGREPIGTEWSPGLGLLAASSALMIVLFVIGAGLLAAAGAVWAYRVRRPKDHSRDEAADYEDEYEQLQRPQWRLFHRKPRWDSKGKEYQGAMKIRFAFQRLLQQRMKSDSSAYTKTPNELRAKNQSDENALIDAYNRVRYGDGYVSTEGIEAAERLLKNGHPK